MDQQSTPAPAAPKSHYWIGAAMVVYRVGGLEKTRCFNVLVRTNNTFLNEKNLGFIQQAAQVRFNREMPPEISKKAKIIDVVTMSTSYIGLMSDEEFHMKRDKDGNIVEEPAS